ncbi:MAG: hypothetical protein ACP5MD_11835 [Verrucomicrobiia bacterium]
MLEAVGLLKEPTESQEFSLQDLLHHPGQLAPAQRMSDFVSRQ